MALTKDEASDLKSLHDAVVMRAVENQMASLALQEARNALDKHMWKLQNPEAKP